MTTTATRPQVAAAPPRPAEQPASRGFVRSVAAALAGAVRFVVRFVLILLSIPPLILTALMPLSALLLMAPAVVPEESVVQDTGPRAGLIASQFRRLFNLLIGCSALLAVVTTGSEVVARLGAQRGFVAWGVGILIVYGLDVAILLLIGRVPLAYNVRNLIVRWPITLLTAVAFTTVVAL